MKVNSVAVGQLGGREVVVSGSSDYRVRIWEASTGKALQVLEGHAGEVNSVALGRLGGREVIVSGSDDKTVRVWEASTGKELQVLGDKNRFAHLALSVTLGRLGVASACRRLHHNCVLGSIASWTLRYCPFVFAGSHWHDQMPFSARRLLLSVLAPPSRTAVA